jgi:hydrogenase maturation factor
MFGIHRAGLIAHELKPHRVRYYLERRDAQFERKMAEVLMVYRDVNLYRADAMHDARPTPIYTVNRMWGGSVERIRESRYTKRI